MDKFRDTLLSPEARAMDLVSRLTIEEKIGQTLYISKAVKRLGIEEYNWWNEALHGVAGAGIATVFPQAIGMAAAFNPELVGKVAEVISTEVRAKHHEAKRKEEYGIYKGLTMFSPNINIFRDPRWGRGQETYGECPYLTKKLGVEFCKALQGNDKKHLKTSATPKHFAVHSGPENVRHSFDAKVSKKDLFETYLPAFRACVLEADAQCVMSAYNRVNGEPCSSSKYLLNELLRDEWGFDGVVISDCGAVEDIHKGHKVTNTPAESAALAMNNGCDLNCGCMYKHIKQALDEGLITETTLDKSVYRNILLRMKLGMFDDDEDIEYAKIPYEVNDCDEHHEICKEITAESIVLLKNDKLLPVKRKKAKNIAVVGPNANSVKALLGNYNGEPSEYSTILNGIKKVHPNANIIYAKGCNVNGIADNNFWHGKNDTQIWEAVSAAERADLVILAVGLNAELEGEESPLAALQELIDENDIPISLPKTRGDREDLGLPQAQIELIKRVTKVGKPTVLLNLTGSCVDMSEFADSCTAILQCWYPGQFGGEVIAKMIFGEYSPNGKLPITFYKNVKDLPDFCDYSMDNRTYRYYEGDVLFPFGYGLSYSQIEYYRIYLSKPKVKAGEDIKVSVMLNNKGKYEVKETVQAYLIDEQSTVKTPLRKLVAFKKVKLKSGEEKCVTLTIKAEEMALVNDEGESVIEPGRFSLYVGGGQPDIVTEKLYRRDALHIGFLVE